MDPSTTEDAALSTASPRATKAPTARQVPHEGLAELIGKRDRGETFPAAPEPLDLSGSQLAGVDLSGLDLSRAKLAGANLVGVNFEKTRLVSADLTNTVLHNATLTGAELLQADLSGADLTNAVIDRTGLGQVTATEAVFFGVTGDGASFSGADLTASDFRAATLTNCRIREVNLSGVDFTNTTLEGVDFGGSKLNKTVFRDSHLSGSMMKGVSGYKTCDWINSEIHGVDFTGAWLVRRYIQDENYLHEFRTQSAGHERLYKVWSITSDCGRSLGRWSLWTVLVAMIYAGLYTQVSIDWGDYETPLSPVYYSVVTFTTLGYGDVLPGSTGAQLLAMSEVILGYFSLGGMMSILSDKMARRAG